MNAQCTDFDNDSTNFTDDIDDYILEICSNNHSAFHNSSMEPCSSSMLSDINISSTSTSFAGDNSIAEILAEREKDLELAARIGKSLLERNKQLQSTNDFLEEQIRSANEQVVQLKHDLQKKIDLLHVYNENHDGSTDSGGSTPMSERRMSSWNILEKKLEILEEENAYLKLELNHLKLLAESLQEKEVQLLNDCSKKIADTNKRNAELNAKLNESTELNLLKDLHLDQQKNETLQRANLNKSLISDNNELNENLILAQEAQKSLISELIDLKERYAEVMDMLMETKAELKAVQQKKENCDEFRLAPILDTSDTLASELEEATAQTDAGYHSFCSGSARRQGPGDGRCSTAFDSSEDECGRLRSTLQPHFLTPRLSCSLPPPTGRRSVLSTPRFDNYDLNSTGETIASPRIECDPSLSVKRTESFNCMRDVTRCTVVPSCSTLTTSKAHVASGLGIPGMPGSKDLNNALQRLSLRQRVELEVQYHEMQKQRRPSTLSTSPLCSLKESSDVITKNTSPPLAHENRPTPATSYLRRQLVLLKSVDQSRTLAQWRHLATPTIEATSLAKKVGVKIKGGSPPITTANSAYFFQEEQRPLVASETVTSSGTVRSTHLGYKRPIVDSIDSNFAQSANRSLVGNSWKAPPTSVLSSAFKAERSISQTLFTTNDSLHYDNDDVTVTTSTLATPLLHNSAHFSKTQPTSLLDNRSLDNKCINKPIIMTTVHDLISQYLNCDVTTQHYYSTSIDSRCKYVTTENRCVRYDRLKPCPAILSPICASGLLEIFGPKLARNCKLSLQEKSAVVNNDNNDTGCKVQEPGLVGLLATGKKNKISEAGIDSDGKSVSQGIIQRCYTR